MAHRHRSWTLLALFALAPAAAPAQPAPAELPRYEAANPGATGGDRLAEPRRLAALIVAQDAAPKRIVEVGSFTGEFLEAFMAQFPAAKGQWTEPVATNRDLARRRLARFGERVDYVIGCPARDIAKGCVEGQADVLISSWLSVHQNGPGIARFYRDAAATVRPGGWIAMIDHVRDGDAGWQRRLLGTRAPAVAEGLAATVEGPPVHHAEFVTPTLADQTAAMRAAGFDAPTVVWRRLDTVLIMARKGQ